MDVSGGLAARMEEERTREILHEMAGRGPLSPEPWPGSCSVSGAIWRLGGIIVHRDAFRKAGEHGILPGELAGRLQEAAGLRNIPVHMCEEIDDGVVAASISPALEDFGRVLQVFEARLAAMDE